MEVLFGGKVKKLDRVLIFRLKQLIGEKSMDKLFVEVVEGIDIKWNCEMINEQGFVKLRSNHGKK